MRALPLLLALISTLPSIGIAQPRVTLPLSQPVLEVNTCRNWLRVDTAYVNTGTVVAEADTVIVIQMKGALADSNGNIVSMGTAGRFERNYVLRVAGDTVFLRNYMLTAYDAGGVVQVVRMTRFPRREEMADSLPTDVEISPTSFDGRAGGVLALYNADTISLWCSLSATATGYRPSEGICTTVHSPNAGVASVGSSGGGGHGGRGGPGRSVGGVTPSPGDALSYTSGVNWLFMGGGPGSIASQSCAGGGILIIDAPGIVGNGYSITAMGGSSSNGMGGGAGGAILTSARSISGLDTFSVAGGSSATGGGGGGGVIRIGTITALNLPASSYAGGLPSNNVGGIGEAGKLFYNVMINETTRPFVAPEFTVSPPTSTCPGTSATLRVYGGAGGAWMHGDDTLCSNCDSVVVSPDVTSTYTVLRTVNGCMDSATTTVTVLKVPVVDLVDTLVKCPLATTTLQAPSGYARYAWTTGDTTTVVTISREGTYSVTVFNDDGCSATDSTVVVDEHRTRMQFVQSVPGIPVMLPDVSPASLSEVLVGIFNSGDSVVRVSAAVMGSGTVLSTPPSQFPFQIQPFDTAYVTIVGASPLPGIYTDTVNLYDQCGVASLPLQVRITETPWFTRCNVRISSSGEIEGLLPEQLNETVVVDMLGRIVAPPLSAGLYVIRVGHVSYVVQTP